MDLGEKMERRRKAEEFIRAGYGTDEVMKRAKVNKPTVFALREKLEIFLGREGEAYARQHGKVPESMWKKAGYKEAAAERDALFKSVPPDEVANLKGLTDDEIKTAIAKGKDAVARMNPRGLPPLSKEDQVVLAEVEAAIEKDQAALVVYQEPPEDSPEQSWGITTTSTTEEVDKDATIAWYEAREKELLEQISDLSTELVKALRKVAGE